MHIPLFGCDATAVKTAARADPTLYLLKKGTILDKWSYANLDMAIPSIAELPAQKSQNEIPMISQISRRIFYGSLVMLGVVVIVFFLFQGFGDPARLILGQRADAGTFNNIRKDLYLDQPKWKQFVYYLNDVSPSQCIQAAGTSGKKYSLSRDWRKYQTGIKIPLSASVLPNEKRGLVHADGSIARNHHPGFPGHVYCDCSAWPWAFWQP